MFTAFLFIVFLAAYAYLFIPNKPRKVTAPAAIPVLITETLEPLPQSAAKEMPVAELVITLEELADLLPISEEPAPAEEISESEPLQPIAPNYMTMGCVELRKACTERRIKWRDVNGKGKHLSTAAMREALLR